jgi:hypothetical protein
MAIDTRADVLATMERTGTPPAALSEVRAHLAMLDGIGRQRYQFARERDEMAAARVATAARLRDLVLESDAELDRERERRHDELAGARATRVRERRQLNDAIDTVRLRETDDVAEIERLVGDAATLGDDALWSEALAIATPRVKALAGAEARTHRQNGPAFAALCRLTAARERGPATDHAAIDALYERRKRETRAAIVSAARVASLDAQLTLALVEARRPVPTDAVTATPRVKAGGFFDSAEYARRFGRRTR